MLPRKATRQIVQIVRKVVPRARYMSSKGPLVDLTVDNEGIATVTMQRLPVNSLNLELLEEMNKAMDEVVKNKSKGMILTSASPTVFSAGLDITEMYKPDMKRVETFWTTLQEMWLRLFGSSFVTAAAINGHAPAGGCLLAMSCEYRVMASGKSTIGLNETALGIVPNNWFVDTMKNTIPLRQAELALTAGTMFTVDEALKVGLIDETGTDKADCIAKCEQFIKRFDKIPALARSTTKLRARKVPIENFMKNKRQNTEEFLSSVSDPTIQKGLENYLIMLKQKKATK